MDGGHHPVPCRRPADPRQLVAWAGGTPPCPARGQRAARPPGDAWRCPGLPPLPRHGGAEATSKPARACAASRAPPCRAAHRRPSNRRRRASAVHARSPRVLPAGCTGTPQGDGERVVRRGLRPAAAAPRAGSGAGPAEALPQPRMPMAVPRPFAERLSAVVRDGRVRQSGQGIPLPGARSHEAIRRLTQRRFGDRRRPSPRSGWLGRKDSNLRSPDPESGALPLGHSPVREADR
jgi:hypothetical protein